MNYQIYIISIPRNKTRYDSLYKKMTQDEKFNNVELFMGVDYKDFDKNTLRKIRSNWSIVAPKPVIACASSHILLWKYISEQTNLDYVIVLEDDSYIKKDLWIKYQSVLEKKINNNVFINLSKSVRLPAQTIVDKLWTKSHIILSLDSYILTPALAGRLYNFFKQYGVTYHIDLHLGFVKDILKFELWHFNQRISFPNLRYQSSMSDHNNKLILKVFSNTEFYKVIKTPIIEINNIIIDTFKLFIFLIIFIILTITFLFHKNINDNILKILWFGLGLLIYDVL